MKNLKECMEYLKFMIECRDDMFGYELHRQKLLYKVIYKLGEEIIKIKEKGS